MPKINFKMGSPTNYFRLLILAWIFQSLIDAQISREEEVLNISSMVRKMVRRRSYNKDIRPGFGGDPLKVNVTISIHDIDDISDVNMDFSVDLHFRQYWRDTRLSFDANISKLFLGGDFYELIWLPDTFFLNGKSMRTHQSTASSRFNTLIELNQNGDILYSTRLTVVASCPMDLSYFPADKQKCELNFGSYGYTIEDIVYEWHPVYDSVTLEQKNLATFIVSGLEQTFLIRNNSVGTFSHLILVLNFKRMLGYYLYQTYIPSFLIVLISWIPFWLGHDDHVERVAIGVTTVLTITTLITSTMESLPKISYVKALDIYLFVCFLMVFLSLIEYALVGYYEHSKRVRFIHKCLCKKLFHDGENQEQILESKIYYDDTSKIDQYSRWIFPSMFILFNLVYIGFIWMIK